MKRKVLLGIFLLLAMLMIFAVSISAADKPVEKWSVVVVGEGSVTATLYNYTESSEYYTLVLSGEGTIKDLTDYSKYPWFYYRSNIKSIIVEEGVKNLPQGGFYDAVLEYVEMADSVEALGYAVFQQCTALKSIKIGDGVKRIGNYAFRSCSGLTSVEFGKSVTLISEGAFSSCTSLTDVQLNEGLTTIGSAAFLKCTALKNIVVPNSVTTIGNTAFQACTSLESMTLPFVGGTSFATTPSASTVFGYIFGNMRESGTEQAGQKYATNSSKIYYIPSSLKNVTITGENVMFGAFSGCTCLENIKLPDGTTIIDDYLFYNCTSLKTVEYSEDVSSIGSYAFNGCAQMESAFINEGVTAIKTFAFYGCSALKTVEIANIESWCDITFENSYSNPLYYASGLSIGGETITSVVIPEGVEEIKPYTFYGFTNLTDIEICSSVKKIGAYAFNNCTSLEAVEIPYGVETIEKCTFNDCKALKNIKIPNSVTFIGYCAFYNCRTLERVIIPDSLTTIDDSAFAHCVSLTNLILGNGLTTIGENSFYECNTLTGLAIPDSVEFIGDYAFGWCSKLTIYVENTSAPSGWSSKWNSSSRPVVWDYKNVLQGNIVIFKGYSFNEVGSMAVGYDIDYEAKTLYEELTGEALEIGVVFAAYDLLNGNQPLDSEGNAITLDDGAVVKFDLTEYDYTYYDFVITDIEGEIADIDLVISAYINNGYENKYVQENGIDDTVTGVSYNSARTNA